MLARKQTMKRGRATSAAAAAEQGDVEGDSLGDAAPAAAAQAASTVAAAASDSSRRAANAALAPDSIIVLKRVRALHARALENNDIPKTLAGEKASAIYMSTHSRIISTG